MTVTPGDGGEPLAAPDIAAALIQRIKVRLLPTYPTLVVTDRFPLDPIRQLPLVVCRLTPGSEQPSLWMLQERVDVDSWAATRAVAWGIADAIRRAFVIRGGFGLAPGASVSVGRANPTPWRRDTGDDVNDTPRFGAGYDLTIRLTSS